MPAMSEEELAHRAGTSRPTLPAYEHGRKAEQAALGVQGVGRAEPGPTSSGTMSGCSGATEIRLPFLCPAMCHLGSVRVEVVGEADYPIAAGRDFWVVSGQDDRAAVRHDREHAGED
jgi:hypothetical protein